MCHLAAVALWSFAAQEKVPVVTNRLRHLGSDKRHVLGESNVRWQLHALICSGRNYRIKTPRLRASKGITVTHVSDPTSTRHQFMAEGTTTGVFFTSVSHVQPRFVVVVVFRHRACCGFGPTDCIGSH